MFYKNDMKRVTKMMKKAGCQQIGNIKLVVRRKKIVNLHDEQKIIMN